jgi:hypothetical protein
MKSLKELNMFTKEMLDALTYTQKRTGKERTLLPGMRVHCT